MQTPQSHFVNCRFVRADESAINESEFMRYEGGYGARSP